MVDAMLDCIPNPPASLKSSPEAINWVAVSPENRQEKFLNLKQKNTMSTATQNLTPVSAISFTLTRIFKKMAPFPEELHRPRVILSIDAGRRRWVVNFQFDGSDHLHSYIGDGKRFQLIAAIREFRQKWGLHGNDDIVGCYEIGRDGLWIRDQLEDCGVPCVVLTSDVLFDGLKTPKTDRQDAKRLAQRLRNFFDGELSPRHVCVPPDADVQKSRCPGRQRQNLVRSRTAAANRFKSIVATQTEVPDKFSMRTVDVDSLRDFRGDPLSGELVLMLRHELEIWRKLDDMIRELQRSMDAEATDARKAVEAGGSAAGFRRHVGMLMRIRGIGTQIAWILASELFGHTFHNGGQVGSATGLVDVPFASGSQARSRGISRRSNSRLRGILLELAWLWLRFQPHSSETGWFERRTAGAGGRQRKICAVGLARRIAVGLWRYLQTGEAPEGMELRGEPTKPQTAEPSIATC